MLIYLATRVQSVCLSRIVGELSFERAEGAGGPAPPNVVAADIRPLSLLQGLSDFPPPGGLVD